MLSTRLYTLNAVSGRYFSEKLLRKSLLQPNLRNWVKLESSKIKIDARYFVNTSNSFDKTQLKSTESKDNAIVRSVRSSEPLRQHDSAKEKPQITQEQAPANETSSAGGPVQQTEEKPAETTENTFLDDSKLSLFAKFKKMYKEYWYILLPVHLTTSAVWFGTFFWMSKSGVDVVSILESYKFSETIINPLRNSDLGHAAIAYLLYKIATPARYFVTLSATTYSIKLAVKNEYIKPASEISQIYKDKRDDLKEKVADAAQNIKDRMSK